MNEVKLKNLLGLAQRARLLVSGNFAVNEALAAEQVKLLIVAKDASRRTQENYQKIAVEKNLPIMFALNKDALGQCLGKGERTVAAILDEGFKSLAIKL